MTKTPARSQRKADESDFTIIIEDQVGFQLRMAQLAVFSDIIEALKETGLRPVDLSALMLIESDPGVRQQAICDRLRMLRPNVVALVDGLEARGLVDRQVDANDRRANQVHLTDDGRRVLRRALDLQIEHTGRVTAVLDGIDVDNFMDGLKRLATLGKSA
ncbi:hypothetical protein ABAC460_13260 [Asticcacaulis sp. AC460]|uniref:MarR family winged helix-turn-helix transcriptional regulator n=1 Tax=Asticcacaulis sp. AC460 TaxID=1282360 RepID=UPI0003C3ED37|nr:MarR family winged helix-turn-helix transcriptional regulator [Asticcacaulis sp. AC460]ESQ89260.1 hypothetical protein ABAC460_13260 [Asticcacaulis sp. AC460]